MKHNKFASCVVKLEDNIFQPCLRKREDMSELTDLFNKLCKDIFNYYDVCEFASEKGLKGKMFSRNSYNLYIYIDDELFPKMFVKGTQFNHTHFSFKVDVKDKFDNDKLEMLNTFLRAMVKS